MPVIQMFACVHASDRLAQSAERKALNIVVVGLKPTVGGLFACVHVCLVFVVNGKHSYTFMFLSDTCTLIHTHTHRHARTHTHTYTHTHLLIHCRTSPWGEIYTHTHTHTDTHAHTHTHTYIGNEKTSHSTANGCE